MNNYTISIPRGTTLVIPITVIDAISKKLHYDSTDTLMFGVKKAFDDTDYIIKKIADYDIENEYYTVMIDVNDTVDLEFDRYFYDVALKTSTNEFYQIIPTSEFNVVYSICQME